MATAGIHGRFGAFYVDQNTTPTTTAQRGVSFLGNITDWSLSGDRDTVDVTVLGERNKTFLSGLANGSGSISGVMSTASNGVYVVSDGIARAFYRYNDDTNSTTRGPIAAGGKGYSYGEATFNGIETSGGVNDAVKFTMNWTLSGDITHV